LKVQKVNFKQFKTAAEVAGFFKSRLPLGESTPEEVIELLNQLGLHHGGLVHCVHPRKRVWDQETRSFTELSLPYHDFIRTDAPAKRDFFLFPNYWKVLFYFNLERLAEIDVEKYDVSL
jgi:hypothetical protein